MKSATAPQVVHESETQRQHVRLPLPARAEIEGKDHEIKDLSSGGVAVRDVAGTYARGQRLPLRLKLPFGSFSMDINVESEVQHFNAKDKVVGCLFINLSADHIALLNYVLKAFIAGD